MSSEGPKNVQSGGWKGHFFQLYIGLGTLAFPREVDDCGFEADEVV